MKIQVGWILRRRTKMYPQLSQEESEELAASVNQFMGEQEYRIGIRRTLAFYAVVFVALVLLAIWIL